MCNANIDCSYDERLSLSAYVCYLLHERMLPGSYNSKEKNNIID